MYTGSVQLKAVRQKYQSVIPLNSCTAVQLYRSVQTQQSAEGYGRLLGISVQTRTARGGFSLRFAQVVPSRAEGQAVVNQVTAQPCSL